MALKKITEVSTSQVLENDAKFAVVQDDALNLVSYNTAIGDRFSITKQMAPKLIWQYPVSRVFGIPDSSAYLPQAICYDPTRSRWAAVARRGNTALSGKLIIADTFDGFLNPSISIELTTGGHCNDIKYDVDNDRFVVCVLGEAGTDAGKTINFYSAATGAYLGNHVFSGDIVVATLDYYGDYVYTYGNQDSDYVYRHNKDFTGTTQLFQLNKTDFRIGIGFDDNEEFMRNTMFIKDGNFYFGICTREILPEATRAILGTMPEAARYGGGFYITDMTGRQVATYLFDYERYEEWQCACVVGKWLYSLTDSGYMSIYKTNFYFPELCRKPSAELVQAESDLNDYFRPGEYICQNSNIERDLLNLPRKHTSGFTLYVIHNMQFGRLQVIVYNNTQASSSNYIYKIYIRKFALTSRNAAGSWAKWERIPVEDIPV